LAIRADLFQTHYGFSARKLLKTLTPAVDYNTGLHQFTKRWRRTLIASPMGSRIPFRPGKRDVEAPAAGSDELDLFEWNLPGPLLMTSQLET